jgi:hypothetical protein
MRESGTATSLLTIRWQALWQLWLGVATALLGCFARPAATPAELWYVVLAVGSSSLLITLLALLLKPEPLVIYIDYRKAQVNCYQPRLAWRVRLPLGQVSCQLSLQASHSGNKHFLVVFGPQGQAWVMQESEGWPLQRLQQLQEMLTFATS